MKTTFLARSLLTAGLLLAGAVSAQTTSKTETITYHDNTAKWVLGHTATVSCSVPVPAACDGDVVSSTTYDATYAMPGLPRLF